jgi:hypothetical protein
MTNKSTETTATAAAAKKLIMYLQGPYERFPSCVHRVDGELVATFRWERGWVYADTARAANIFQRALAVTLLKAGDIVCGWTKNGWQFGEYVEGNGKSHIFRTADGTTYSTEVAEPHAFKRGDEVLAKVDGQWLPASFRSIRTDNTSFTWLLLLAPLPTEWQVSHLAFPPQCRQPILRS